jgi:hypothetical protein
VKNPIRNETSLVLAIAVIFSAVAIPVLSGFLEPSQPPAVAAVQIGDPRDRSSGKDDSPSAQPREPKPAPARSEHRAQAPTRKEATRPARAQPAPSPPADDLAEDDGEDAD